MFVDIKGYEGLYQINTNGVIRSLPKKAMYKGHSYLNGRILKQEVIKKKHTSYRRITLSKMSKIKRFLVHRLVAEHFIPNTENKPHINHIDNNGENNNVDNLEWVTHSENMKHCHKQGRSNQMAATKASIPIIINQSKKRWMARIGKQFGSWVILDVKSLGKHPKGNVLCLKCNTTYENRTLDGIVIGDSKHCIKHRHESA